MTTRERRRQARALWEKACVTVVLDWGCPPSEFERTSGLGCDAINAVCDAHHDNCSCEEIAIGALLDGLRCEDLP